MATGAGGRYSDPRSSLAHGLLDDGIAKFLYSLYAWWWLLRLVISGPRWLSSGVGAMSYAESPSTIFSISNGKNGEKAVFSTGNGH